MEFRKFFGGILTCLALMTGYASAQNLNQKSQEQQVYFIQDNIGQVEISIHSTSKEKLPEELKKIKKYWTESQKELIEVLEAKKMKLLLTIDADSKENSIIAHIVEPYKAEDSEIFWRQICVDKDGNSYVINRRSSKSKSGLKKDSDCCNKISVTFQCMDERQDKSLKETFIHVMEIAGACKLPKEEE